MFIILLLRMQLPTCGRTCVQRKPSLSLSAPGEEEEGSNYRYVLKQSQNSGSLSLCYHESFDGSVEWVQQYTGYRTGLGRPVPAIRAVDQHTDTFISHSLRERWRRWWLIYLSYTLPHVTLLQVCFSFISQMNCFFCINEKVSSI